MQTETKSQHTPGNGLVAWFVCRAAGITDDVMLPLRRLAPDAEISKRGRMVAARIFKRRHELHPCRKVECEFQGVEAEGR